eukprot:TRINITY_DN581_c0_g2_i5.p1 TRINITY_DN581_c0_g2~~TRINITY_DN581_c0_g2_i5.p1  ORF type:complete len:444 (-),score=38.55 TRINITY_DN581_c0_g2_i5:359-1690(-)
MKLKFSNSNLRFVILALSCLVLISINYCNDIPSIIKNDFLVYFSQYPNLDAEYVFDMLYTTYSIPNIVIPIFGGIICDKLGSRLMTLVLYALVLIGQTLFSASLFLQNFHLMIIARFLCGVGGETIKNTVTKLLMHWFADKEIALAQAIKTSSSRFTFIANAMVSSSLVMSAQGVTKAINLGTMMVFGSFIATILLCGLDYLAERQWKDTTKKDEKVTLKEICRGTMQFPPMYWSLAVISTLVYMCWQLIQTCSSSYMSDVFSHNDLTPAEIRQNVGFLLALQSFIGMVLTPLFGCFIDRYGKRVILLGLALIVLLACLLLFIVTHPIFPMILFGLTTSIFSATLWPTVNLIVKDKYFSTSYGVLSSINNIGLSLSPVIISRYKGKDASYVNLFFLFSCLCVLAFMFYIDFIRRDYYRKSNQVYLHLSNYRCSIPELDSTKQD